MPMISSPFNFFSIVVFPALSRPLRRRLSIWEFSEEWRGGALLQEENAHLLLLLSVLADDREETHSVAIRQAHCKSSLHLRTLVV